MSDKDILQADLALQKKKLGDLKAWNSPADLIADQEALIAALEEALKTLLTEIVKAVE